MSGGVHDYDEDLGSMPQPRGRRQNVSHPLWDQQVPAHFRGQEISEAEIVSVGEVLPAIRELPPVREMPPVAGHGADEQLRGISDHELIDTGAELNSGPEVEANEAASTEAAGESAPIAEQPTGIAEAFEDALASFPDLEDEITEIELVPQPELPPRPAPPSKRVVIRARQAHPTGSPFLPLFGKSGGDSQAISHALAATGHVQPGQLAMISYEERACPDYRSRVDEFITDLREGKNTSNRKRAVGALSLIGKILGDGFRFGAALTRFTAKVVGFFLHQTTGHKREEDPKLAKQRQVKVRDEEPTYVLSDEGKEIIKLVKGKRSEQAHFEVELRVVTAALAEPEDENEVGYELAQLANDITDAYSGLGSEHHDGLGWHACDEDGIDSLIGIMPDEAERPLYLSNSELAALAHFPDDTTGAYGINIARSKIKPLRAVHAPRSVTEYLHPTQGLLPLGITDRASIDERFIAIENKVLDTHLMVTGKTGTGKSTLIQHLAHGVVADNYPLVLIAPHASLVDELLELLCTHAPQRLDDIVVIDVGDEAFPPALNPFDIADDSQIQGAASQVEEMLAAHAEFTSSVQTRATTLVNVASQALASANIEVPMSDDHILTPLHLIKFFTNPEFRHMVIEVCAPITSVTTWFDPDNGQFENIPERNKAEVIAPIVRALTDIEKSTAVARTLATINKLDFAKLIGENKIVLCKLARFEGDAGLGTMLARMIFPAVLGSMNQTSRGCRVIVDEAPTIADSYPEISNFLAEARKWDFGLTMVSQFPKQYDSDLLESLYANTASKISLSLDPNAEAGMAAALSPSGSSGLTKSDVGELPPFCAYANITVGKQKSGPFFFETLPPVKSENTQHFRDQLDQIKRQSREAVGADGELAAARLVGEERVIGSMKEMRAFILKRDDQEKTPPPLFPDEPEDGHLGPIDPNEEDGIDWNNIKVG